MKQFSSGVMLVGVLLSAGAIYAQDFSAFEYRNVGPSRGGRVTAVAGNRCGSGYVLSRRVRIRSLEKPKTTARPGMLYLTVTSKHPRLAISLWHRMMPTSFTSARVRTAYAVTSFRARASINLSMLVCPGSISDCEIPGILVPWSSIRPITISFGLPP